MDKRHTEVSPLPGAKLIVLDYFRQGQLPQEVMDHPEHEREQQHRENRVLAHHQQYSIHLLSPSFVTSPVLCSGLPKAIPSLFGLSWPSLYSLLPVTHCLAFLSSLRQWEGLNSVHYSPPLCQRLLLLQLLQAEWCERGDGKRGGVEKRDEKREGSELKNGQEPRRSYVALFHEIITGMSEPEAITFFKALKWQDKMADCSHPTMCCFCVCWEQIAGIVTRHAALHFLFIFFFLLLSVVNFNEVL